MKGDFGCCECKYKLYVWPFEYELDK